MFLSRITSVLQFVSVQVTYHSPPTTQNLNPGETNNHPSTTLHDPSTTLYWLRGRTETWYFVLYRLNIRSFFFVDLYLNNLNRNVCLSFFVHAFSYIYVNQCCLRKQIVLFTLLLELISLLIAYLV